MSPVLGSSGILHRSCIGQTYQSVPFSPFWKKQIWTPFLPLQDMDQHWPNQSNLAMANDDTVLEEENLHRFDACFLGHHCKKGWPETWNILRYNIFCGWVKYFVNLSFLAPYSQAGPSRWDPPEDKRLIPNPPCLSHLLEDVDFIRNPLDPAQNQPVVHLQARLSRSSMQFPVSLYQTYELGRNG